MYIAEASCQKKARYICVASENCSHAGRRDNIIHHVLRRHVEKSLIPHGCNLCGYRCPSLGMLKGHRSWYSPHATAMKKAAADGKQINEDKMEYHSDNPVNVEELIKKVDSEYL